MTQNKVDEGVKLVDSMTPEELNQLVDYIRVVFKTKRQQANARAQAGLKVGDKVQLTGSYKPAYLQGLTGTVTEKRNTRVTVQLDDGPIGKFRSGNVIATPSGLTVIS
jgi:preprotein translocase subunit YajC